MIIYERCWKEEECIRVLGERYCASVEACIKIFEEQGRIKLQLKLFDEQITYDLLNTCYPVYEVGIGRLSICVSDIRISNSQLRSVKVIAELCIGTDIAGVKRRRLLLESRSLTQRAYRSYRRIRQW